MTSLDCVIVGYNDIPFDSLAKKHHPLRFHSGTYSELRSNSVLISGKRRNYMELLNHVSNEIHGVDPQLNAFDVPNLGVVYLASFLLKRGLYPEIVNLFSSDLGRARLRDLLDEKPNAVVITTTYYVDDDPIRGIVEFVREYNETTKIIVGGPYVHNLCTSSTPQVQDEIFESIGADIYVHDSQGESTLALVLRALQDGSATADLSDVPNLIYRQGASWARSERRIETNDLDKNAIDWSYLSPDFFAPTAYMRTARSCPFSCAFCNYPAMSGAHTLVSLDTIRVELRYLSDRGVKHLIFVDDTFNVPMPRFKKLCRMMIEERFDLQWISFFRCSNADTECFDLMRESGCIGVYLGVESGDDGILKNMNKYAKVDAYRRGIRELTARGIMTFGSFIVGYPGETQESVMNTVGFLQDMPTTFFNAQLYYHDPIAPINRRREEFAIEGGHYSWKHRTMCWEEASDWVEYVLRSVEQAIPLTLWGFSIWSIPYLLEQGLSIQQIIGYARCARKMLIKTLGDADVNMESELAEMTSVLQGWTPIDPQRRSGAIYEVQR